MRLPTSLLGTLLIGSFFYALPGHAVTYTSEICKVQGPQYEKAQKKLNEAQKDFEAAKTVYFLNKCDKGGVNPSSLSGECIIKWNANGTLRTNKKTELVSEGQCRDHYNKVKVDNNIAAGKNLFGIVACFKGKEIQSYAGTPANPKPNCP